MVGKRSLTGTTDEEPHYENGDIETGSQRPKNHARRFKRFKDVVDTAVADRKRQEIKAALMKGVNPDGLEKYRKSDEELKQISNKKIRGFYEKQNASLDNWIEVDTIVMSIADDILDSFNPDADNDGHAERHGALHEVEDRIEELLPDETREARRKAQSNAKWAINVNVVANVLLLAGKAFAATQSSSLSLIASLVDSGLDLLCTLIVWTTNRLVDWRLSSLKRRFPVGRKRLEPIGILVFSVIMVISFFQILQESVQRFFPGGNHSVVTLSVTAWVSMAATIVIKGIIWIGCAKIKTTQVQALAQDCKTDVLFNTVSLLFPLIGSQANIWWLDPLGAGLLSLFIIYDWGSTSLENVTRLSGSAVDDALQQKLTYLAYRFAPVVHGIKNIVAYHAGDGVWAEYDVLFEENTPLYRAHDVAETLQYCCEGMTEVDRAFVTTDYTVQNPGGHANTGG